MGQILIVDDDAAIRSLLALISRRAGFDVDTAHDGIEAIEKLERHRHLIVLLDLMMPRMNGYEVIDYLRKSCPRPAVFAVTAMTDPFLQELDPAVVHAIVRKPFDVELVASLIVDCARAIGSARGGAVPLALDGPSLIGPQV